MMSWLICRPCRAWSAGCGCLPGNLVAGRRQAAGDLAADIGRMDIGEDEADRVAIMEDRLQDIDVRQMRATARPV